MKLAFIQFALLGGRYVKWIQSVDTNDVLGGHGEKSGLSFE